MTNTAFPGQAVTIFVSTGGSTTMTLQYLLHAPECRFFPGKLAGNVFYGRYLGKGEFKKEVGKFPILCRNPGLQSY